jgi:hypothetical protein
MRKIPVTEAVGSVLCHDITRVIPGKDQYPAYKKGKVISQEDIPGLKDLGKENVFVWDSDPDIVHEDDAALRLAEHACGPGLMWAEPRQGRLNIKARNKGLFKVRVEQLSLVNNLEDVIFASLHNNRVVEKDQTVAGTRIIPLTIPINKLDKAEKLCSTPAPLFEIKEFIPYKIGLITSGNEVYKGRIPDAFCPLIRQKIKPFEAELLEQVLVPDDSELIAQEIEKFIEKGAELIFITGGMSVDADDVTPAGIKATGADIVFYGAPVLPGSQFMLAYLGQVPICGVPGGALYARRTTFDLLLPRIMAGDRINRAEVMALGHGGLCEECEVCRYPVCSFGKSI